VGNRLVLKRPQGRVLSGRECARRVGLTEADRLALAAALANGKAAVTNLTVAQACAIVGLTPAAYCAAFDLFQFRGPVCGTAS
jgi:hypothetical protein